MTDDIPARSLYQSRATGRIIVVTREEIEAARKKQQGDSRDWRRTRDSIGLGKLAGTYPAVKER